MKQFEFCCSRYGATLTNCSMSSCPNRSRFGQTKLEDSHEESIRGDKQVPYLPNLFFPTLKRLAYFLFEKCPFLCLGDIKYFTMNLQNHHNHQTTPQRTSTTNQTQPTAATNNSSLPLPVPTSFGLLRLSLRLSTSTSRLLNLDHLLPCSLLCHDGPAITTFLHVIGRRWHFLV